MKTVSILMFVLGCIGAYWMNSRAFNRRNVAGVEEFKNYASSVLIRTVEKIVSIGSWLFIIAGAATFLMNLGYGK